MGLFRKSRPSAVTVYGKALNCLVCGGTQFWDRELKMNSTGMELLDLGWANASSLGLICVRCGYVHEFVGDAVELWEVQDA
jgi:predicted nucleic-acid-binding Zn-ribbon protein